MRFVDSSGNELLLMYDGRERVDVSGAGMGENRTMHCEASAFMNSAKFISGADQGFGFKEHVWGTLLFNHGRNESYVGDYWTDTLILQSRTYDNCDIRYSDTTHSYMEFVFDKDYGIVLMAKENEYRWERVLN